MSEPFRADPHAATPAFGFSYRIEAQWLKWCAAIGLIGSDGETDKLSWPEYGTVLGYLKRLQSRLGLGSLRHITS